MPLREKGAAAYVLLLWLGTTVIESLRAVENTVLEDKSRLDPERNVVYQLYRGQAEEQSYDTSSSAVQEPSERSLSIRR